MPFHFDSIEPARAALIVIDLQNDFVAPGALLQLQEALDLVPTVTRLLSFCRSAGIKVLYTKHVFRADGSDMGLIGDVGPALRERRALIEGTPGVEIYPALKAQPGEHVISKSRFSAFFGTDLDTILRGWGVNTLIICGATLEGCCHATARDAFFRDYRTIILSDATVTQDSPDLGFGRLAADEVRRVMLTALAKTTAHVTSVNGLISLVEGKRAAHA